MHLAAGARGSALGFSKLMDDLQRETIYVPAPQLRNRYRTFIKPWPGDNSLRPNFDALLMHRAQISVSSWNISHFVFIPAGGHGFAAIVFGDFGHSRVSGACNC